MKLPLFWAAFRGQEASCPGTGQREIQNSCGGAAGARISATGMSWDTIHTGLFVSGRLARQTAKTGSLLERPSWLKHSLLVLTSRHDCSLN